MAEIKQVQKKSVGPSVGIQVKKKGGAKFEKVLDTAKPVEPKK
jgi:hypothetical protein